MPPKRRKIATHRADCRPASSSGRRRRRRRSRAMGLANRFFGRRRCGCTWCPRRNAGRRRKRPRPPGRECSRSTIPNGGPPPEQSRRAHATGRRRNGGRRIRGSSSTIRINGLILLFSIFGIFFHHRSRMLYYSPNDNSDA